jgi:ADP-heptose:LPS heptosyltransferase
LSQNIRHIVIFRLSAMGDVAMTVPLVKALSEQHSSIKVTVVSRPFFKPLFDSIPNVTFFAIDVKKRHKGVLGLIRLFFDLRKLNIDAFADLHNVLRSKIVRYLFAFIGKKTAATDKGRSQKKELTRSVNKIFKPVSSMFERQLETFEKLGINISLENPTFNSYPLSPEIIAIIGDKTNQKWIGIAPFAQYESKVYPLDLMQQVIDEMSQDPTIQMFLFGGGEKEIVLLNSLASTHQNCIVVAGKLNFNQEIQLISNLDVMLSMDSGNGHIAAMLGKKVVTLWGATHPYAGFLPFQQSLENSLTPNRELYPLLPTSIYGNKKVEGYEEAMRTITPEAILKKIHANLE